MANLEEHVDRILKIVIETQEDVKNLGDRVGRLYDRLADRIERLEKQRI
jgi:hypothetical protein